MRQPQQGEPKRRASQVAPAAEGRAQRPHFLAAQAHRRPRAGEGEGLHPAAEGEAAPRQDHQVAARQDQGGQRRLGQDDRPTPQRQGRSHRATQARRPPQNPEGGPASHPRERREEQQRDPPAQPQDCPAVVVFPQERGRADEGGKDRGIIFIAERAQGRAGKVEKAQGSSA